MKHDIYNLHTSSNATWLAILEKIDEAHTEIIVEEFIITPCPIGTVFLKRLHQKAREGIQVKILVDWWGSKQLYFSKLLEIIQHDNLTIKFYNPPQWSWLLKPKRFFPRNHRKLFIIDQKIIFLGGVCLSQDIKNWRDTMLEIHDIDIVHKAHYFFQENWHSLKAKNVHKYQEYYQNDLNAENDLIIHNPDDTQNVIYNNLCDKLKSAHTHIIISTPYLSLNQKFLDLLCNIAQKGVKIEIILSRYSEYSAYIVGQYQIGQLIKCGINVYYFNPSMFHLKAIVIDKKWSAIGSFNLDNLSIFHNEEIMFISACQKFAHKLVNHAKEDIELAEKMTYQTWQNRPIKDKIMEYVFYPFKYYL